MLSQDLLNQDLLNQDLLNQDLPDVLKSVGARAAIATSGLEFAAQARRLIGQSGAAMSDEDEIWGD